MKNNKSLMVYTEGKNLPTIIKVTENAMKFFEHTSDEGIAKTVLNIAAYCCPELCHSEPLSTPVELTVLANERGDNWDVVVQHFDVLTIEE